MNPHHKHPKSKRPAAGKPSKPKPLTIYGRHAVKAALNNPHRIPIRLYLSQPDRIEHSPDIKTEITTPTKLDSMAGDTATHQGVVLEAKPLPKIDLAHWLKQNPNATRIVVLDQISDPRNLGAILRSALAFDTDAVIVPTHRSAELNGACARAAAGALDIIPLIEVANLARSLNKLKQDGFWTIGLDGSAERTLPSILPVEKSCLILGSEGHGIRRLVAENCDFLANLPINPALESLNVSVAASIALYELTQPGRK